MKHVKTLKYCLVLLLIAILPAALALAAVRNDSSMAEHDPNAAKDSTKHGAMSDSSPSQPMAQGQGDHGAMKSAEPQIQSSNSGGKNSILEHLTNPEYLHVLLNPMPVYGLSMGAVALVIALISRRRAVMIAALILIFLSGLSAWPTYYYGEAAYDRVKEMSDPEGAQWLDEHMARGEKLIWAFYVLAAIAAAGVAIVAKWPRYSLAAGINTLALAGGTLAIGGYISYAGGHVRHKEFRFEPPPMKMQASGHHQGAEGEKDHGAMQGKPAQGQMDHGAMQPKPAEGAQQAETPSAEQLEASRLQLEASRLQLEASRKQLEAADAAKKQSPSPGPQKPQPSPSPDSHEHKH